MLSGGGGGGGGGGDLGVFLRRNAQGPVKSCYIFLTNTRVRSPLFL